MHHGTIQAATGPGGHHALFGPLFSAGLRAHLSLAQAVELHLTPARVMDMAAYRSSTVHPEPRPAAAAKRARGSVKKAAVAAGSGVALPTPAKRSSQAAEMLREIEIDGEALSVQIERLRHRFL